jgi:hypothetical protein
VLTIYPIRVYVNTVGGYLKSVDALVELCLVGFGAHGVTLRSNLRVGSDYGALKAVEVNGEHDWKSVKYRIPAAK